MKYTPWAGNAQLLIFSIAVMLGSGAAAAHGQSALDGFDPNPNGSVRAVVVQEDGKVLAGGDFTIVAGQTRNHIARTLESKTNLNTNVWSPVTNAPAVSGTNNVVTNTIGGSARFYRLRQ
jgi:hypothetical protein